MLESYMPGGKVEKANKCGVFLVFKKWVKLGMKNSARQFHQAYTSYFLRNLILM